MRNLFAALLLYLISFSAPAAPVQRVISLSPHTTELAWSAGLGNKIIAVSEHSDYPPQAEHLPKVANYQGINVEKILSLKPDLVITWPAGNPPRELNKLKQMGLTLYPSRIKTLDDIATDIEALSQYAEHPETGQKNAQKIRAAIQSVQQKYQHSRKVRFFYQLSEKPLITIAQDSWPGEVFRLCGGENVFQNAAAPYPQVSLEKVLIARPEVIFYTSEQQKKAAGLWADWPRIPAVKHDYIWPVHADWINRPTLRTLKAVEQVCKYFDQVRKLSPESSGF